MIEIKKQIADSLAEHLPAESENIENLLQIPPEPEMGDYALPCFVFAKKLKKSPAKIAEKLAENLSKPDGINEFHAEGPYLNISVDRPRMYSKLLGSIVKTGKEVFSNDSGKGKTVVIDYSSPNIAKHLAVHHLRSAIIGRSLYNIFQACGYHCIGINHLGDWGTSFGKLIAAFERYSDVSPQDADVSDLQNLYVRFSKESEENPELEDLGRRKFKELENGDPEATKLWKQFKKISIEEFKKIYELLGIEFDAYTPESFYLSLAEDLLNRLRAKDIAMESENAVIADLEEQDMPPLMLQKNDGTTLYATRDLCAAEYRWINYRFEHCIYVVGGEQKLHFRQLKTVLKKMGYDWSDRIEHIDFGLLKLRDPKTGKASVGSTRKGDMILLEDVLKNGIERAKEKLNENIEKLSDDADLDKLAARIGIGAVMFSDLAVKRNKDVVFDWDRMLDFHGDTGPYVQYAHARLCSILRKAGVDVRPNADCALLKLPEEWKLVRLIEIYPSRIMQAAEKREPSIIANYLLNLCKLFSSYYSLGMKEPEKRVICEDQHVLGARLMLVEATKNVIAHGLELLGMNAPERM